MTTYVQAEAEKYRIIDNFVECNIYKAQAAMVEYNYIFLASDSDAGQKIAAGNLKFCHTFHFY